MWTNAEQYPLYSDVVEYSKDERSKRQPEKHSWHKRDTAIAGQNKLQVTSSFRMQTFRWICRCTLINLSGRFSFPVTWCICFAQSDFLTSPNTSIDISFDLLSSILAHQLTNLIVDMGSLHKSPEKIQFAYKVLPEQ